MSEVFSILLHNRQRYEQGKEGLWFSLPTTTEKLQEALREIGISADNPQDFFLYDYRSPQERPIKLPRDLVLSADVDELNFLAARLGKLDAAELVELNAALTSRQSDFRSIGQIIDYPDNVDYYVHLPDVTDTGQLGDYYLNRSGKEEAHYCDSLGFTPVPEFFLQREKQLTPRELLTGESIQTPRGSFLVTDMSREQLEAAGYGFHHQSEDGKYLIMGNGTDAFAIPAQQESPIKAAEMTTEQNYNVIDGVLNNAPTMSELEAKAKAGEQISLFDVAEAAKAEARKPKQPQRPAQKQKKPSIRAQLKAAKEEQQKKPPQREKAQELEV